MPMGITMSHFTAVKVTMVTSVHLLRSRYAIWHNDIATNRRPLPPQTFHHVVKGASARTRMDPLRVQPSSLRSEDEDEAQASKKTQENQSDTPDLADQAEGKHLRYVAKMKTERYHNKEEDMTEWHDLHNKISDLRRGLKDKPVEHTLDLMLSLLSQIVTRQEHGRLESDQHPIHRSLAETRMTLLTSRIETLEADAQWDRRRIDKQMDAIHTKLDAILAKLPEPPQGFNE